MANSASNYIKGFKIYFSNAFWIMTLISALPRRFPGLLSRVLQALTFGEAPLTAAFYVDIVQFSCIYLHSYFCKANRPLSAKPRVMLYTQSFLRSLLSLRL